MTSKSLWLQEDDFLLINPSRYGPAMTPYLSLKLPLFCFPPTNPAQLRRLLLRTAKKTHSDREEGVLAVPSNTLRNHLRQKDRRVLATLFSRLSLNYTLGTGIVNRQFLFFCPPLQNLVERGSLFDFLS